MPRLDLTTRDVRQATFAGGPLEYVLVRRRGRRGVGLKVDETGLTVSAPLTMPVAKVEAVMQDSERWIRRKIEEWRGRQVPQIRWEEGTWLPYLGRPVSLRISPAGRAQVALQGEELRVAVREPHEEAVRRAVTGWYRQEARTHLAARVETLAARAGIEPPRFLLSSAMSRWGSCNSRREVRLAWRLVKAPEPLIDYVVCHELAHLRHMNHSAAFWREVARQCPSYEAHRAELFATDHLYRSF
jgi:predicted metal-dependent hydrolase